MCFSFLFLGDQPETKGIIIISLARGALIGSGSIKKNEKQKLTVGHGTIRIEHHRSWTAAVLLGVMTAVAAAATARMAAIGPNTGRGHVATT